MKKIGDKYTNNTFENIKHIDKHGNEYWYARELSKVLEYYDSLSDDEKRFYKRKLTKQGNYTLQRAASAVGVKKLIFKVRLRSLKVILKDLQEMKK